MYHQETLFFAFIEIIIFLVYNKPIPLNTLLILY